MNDNSSYPSFTITIKNNVNWSKSLKLHDEKHGKNNMITYKVGNITRSFSRVVMNKHTDLYLLPIRVQDLRRDRIKGRLENKCLCNNNHICVGCSTSPQSFDQQMTVSSQYQQMKPNMRLSELL